MSTGKEILLIVLLTAMSLLLSYGRQYVEMTDLEFGLVSALVLGELILLVVGSDRSEKK